MTSNKLVTCCKVGTNRFLENIPEKIIGQILCHIMVIQTNFCLLLKLPKISLFKVVVIYCPEYFLKEARKEIVKNFSEIISWSHEKVDDCKDSTPPPFVSSLMKLKMKKKLPM